MARYLQAGRVGSLPKCWRTFQPSPPHLNKSEMPSRHKYKPNYKPLPDELRVDRELTFRTEGRFHFVEIESGYKIPRRLLWNLWNRGELDLVDHMAPHEGPYTGDERVAVSGYANLLED